MPKGVFIRTEKEKQRLRDSSKIFGFKKGRNNPSKGKTYEEIYGINKGNIIREKVRQTSKDRYNNDPNVKKILEYGTTKAHKFQSDSMKLKWANNEYRNRVLSKKKMWLESEEGKEYRTRLSLKMSQIKKDEWADPNHTYHTKQYVEKVSIGRKIQWQNPESALRNMLSNGKSPNKQEMRVSYILRKLYPHCFKYNGDARLKLVFGGKTPDFVNVNGKKQVIEFLGTWWHGQKRTGRTKEEEEYRLINHYLKFGFKCLPIWEKELDNKANLKNKIMEFVDG